jgi:hypothetical protein
MALSLDLPGTDNNRCLQGHKQETPANRLVIILKVSAESNKVVPIWIECSNCMVRGVSVIPVSTSVGEPV